VTLEIRLSRYAMTRECLATALAAPTVPSERSAVVWETSLPIENKVPVRSGGPFDRHNVGQMSIRLSSQDSCR
jgi:hypothetical protein